MPRSFKLLEALGEGAFGSVHLAEVHEDGGYVQRLAVKWLHPHLSDDHEQARRLRDEARLLALLSHEHIVRVHGFTRIDGRLAVLMEPVQGADLSRLGAVPVPPRAAAEIVEAVADALDAAWETIPSGQDAPLRVVHRDIKPSNIMVTPRGAVKVLDFGVARATFGARESDTRSQQFGTARFMAPERWLQGRSGAGSDVFSLGITLVEILTCHEAQRPRLAREAFEEDIHETLALVDRWPELQGLVSRMLAFEAEARPTSRDVARQCRALSTSLPGADLKAWAADWVPRHQTPPVPTKGERVLVEDTSADTLRDPRPIDATEPYLGPGATESLAPPREVEPPVVGQRRMAWLLGGMVFLTAVAAVWALPDRPSRSPERPSLVAPAADAPAPAPTSARRASVEAPAPAPPAPAPAPEDVPASRPAVVTAPATAVLPASEPLSPPIPATGTVTFLLDPPDLAVTAGWGKVRHRKAVELTQGVHQLSVGEGVDAWRCTVIVDGSTPTWRVDARQRSCVQVH